MTGIEKLAAVNRGKLWSHLAGQGKFNIDLLAQAEKGALLTSSIKTI